MTPRVSYMRTHPPSGPEILVQNFSSLPIDPFLPSLTRSLFLLEYVSGSLCFIERLETWDLVPSLVV